jgi:hypothetical protein
MKQFYYTSIAAFLVPLGVFFRQNSLGNFKISHEILKNKKEGVLLRRPPFL